MAESEFAVSESNFAGSIIMSSAGDDEQNIEKNGHDEYDGASVEQLDEIQNSGLEKRQQEATAMRDLERDMTDLLDIHNDLNVHIHSQGEDIDRIELQTEKASNRVSKGHESTKVAVEINRDSKTLIWIIVGISSGVILIVLIIIIILIAVLTTR